MTLRSTSVIWIGAALAVLAGCTSMRGAGSRQGKPGNQSPLTVALGDQGIVDGRFMTPQRPQILAEGSDLLLEDRSDLDFDVTFVLDISDASMRQYLGRSDQEGETLTAQFIDKLKADPGMAVYDAECLRQRPRCEVTFQTSERSVARVPYALLDLGGAKIAAFYVFVVKRGSTRQTDEFVDAQQARGYVGLATKFVPELEIPLDNTGIADWGFLNPRSPRALPGSTMTLQTDVKRPIPAGQQKAEDDPLSEAVDSWKTKFSRDPDAPAALAEDADRVAASVLILREKAVTELKTIQASRITGFERAQLAIELIEQRGIRRFRGLPIEEEGRKGDSASDCPQGKSEDPPLSKVLVHAIRMICGSTLWAMEKVAAAGTPVEGEAAVDLAMATLEAVTAARTIITTSLLSNYLEASYGEKAAPLLDKIDAARKKGQRALDAVLVDPSISSATKHALGTLAAGRAKDEMAELVVDAGEEVHKIKVAIDRFVLRQRLVRFSNETLDRRFVVTFEVDRDKLLEDAPPCQEAQKLAESLRQTAPEDRPQDPSLEQLQAPLIKCIEAEYGDAVSLTPTDGTVTVSSLIDPGSKVDIDAWLLSKAPKDIVPFEVDFFDQTDDPAYSKGYIARKVIDPKDTTAQPENKFTTNLITGFTGADEPCFGKLDDCKGTLNEVPYDGKMKRHYSATGQADFSQDLGNRANGKLSLQYKKSDLGKDDGTTVSQYQINIFGTNNTTFTLGKFSFVQPSNQIAASVTGEGLRFTFHNFGVSYLVSRESDDGSADAHNKDHDLLLAQWRQPINRFGFFRRLELLALRGEDRCKPRPADVAAREGGCPIEKIGEVSFLKAFPHTYTTIGGELFFTVPFGPSPADPRERRLPLTGSAAYYRSWKDSRQTDPPPADPLFLDMRDGEGSVALLTIGRPFGFVEEKPGSKKVKPTRVLTSLVGWGSGDDPKTGEEDEGYLGETAAFTRDQIFLTGIALRRGGTQANQALAGLGKGLSNKWYFGLQYTDNTTSLLEWIAALLQVDRNDIVSQSTTISLHSYRLHEPVFNNRDGGFEADIEFRMEQPRSVKWRLVGGYFIPGDAVSSVVKKEVWTVTAGVVVEPARLAF